MGLGDRLREERIRLGLNQETLGKIGGVRKQAQLLYEKGERKPDSGYLTAIAEAGIDVLYILTGQRTPAASVPPSPPRPQIVPALDEEGLRRAYGSNELAYVPPPDEMELLSNYRGSSAEGRAVIRATSQAAAKAAHAANHSRSRRRTG